MKNREGEVIWTWFRYAWAEHRFRMGLVLVLSLVNAVLVTAFPWLWQFIINAVQTPGATGSSLSEIAVWMLIVGVAQVLLYVVLQGTRSIMNARIQWRLRERVYEHITGVEAHKLKHFTPGDLVTRLTDDAGDKASWFLCSGVFRSLEASLVILACLAAMTRIDVHLTFFVVLPLPLLILAQFLAQGALHRRYKAVQSAISRINEQLNVFFSGIQVLRASRLEGRAIDRFAEEADAQRQAEVQVAAVQQGVFLLYGYGWQLAMAALILVGGSAVISGSISLGQLITFEGYTMTLVWPMFDLGMFLSRYKQTLVSLKRLDTLLEIAPAPVGTRTPEENVPPLVTRDLGLATPEGKTLLDGVSLSVSKGQRIAIVGEVGAGKSTLLALLAGLTPPSTGSVAAWGIALPDFEENSRGRVLALVPQDPVLLSTTLRENILLGREANAAALDHVLDLSCLSADMPGFSKGLDTLVGERGLTLSGGQRQRVAIARALVGDPGLLLLDDPTSALDADTEDAFWKKMEAHCEGLTTVVVSHRPSTIESADRILVLEEGKLVQNGSHTALVQTPGPYRRIYGRFQVRERIDQESLS